MNAEKSELKDIPYHHVLAVVQGDTAVKTAQRELRQQGYEPIVLRGEEVARTIDPKGEYAGPLAKVVQAVEDHLSEERNFLAQYQEEAREGKEVIAVLVGDRDHSGPVVEILERVGAHNIRYFGRLAVTDLTPESNPSSRDETSPESDKWSHE